MKVTHNVVVLSIVYIAKQKIGELKFEGSANESEYSLN